MTLDSGDKQKQGRAVKSFPKNMALTSRRKKQMCSHYHVSTILSITTKKKPKRNVGAG